MSLNISEEGNGVSEDGICVVGVGSELVEDALHDRTSHHRLLGDVHFSTTSSSMDTPTSTSPTTDGASVHHASPVVAFIIGLAIILLASVLNAAGLNLTKLDHVRFTPYVYPFLTLAPSQVRTNAIPKSARRRDWLRPLWLLGMTLYILSQLIGSTLALDYMRAGKSSSSRIHTWVTHASPSRICRSSWLHISHLQFPFC